MVCTSFSATSSSPTSRSAEPGPSRVTTSGCSASQGPDAADRNRFVPLGFPRHAPRSRLITRWSVGSEGTQSAPHPSNVPSSWARSILRRNSATFPPACARTSHSASLSENPSCRGRASTSPASIGQPPPHRPLGHPRQLRRDPHMQPRQRPLPIHRKKPPHHHTPRQRPTPGASGHSPSRSRPALGHTCRPVNRHTTQPTRPRPPLT